MAKAKVKRKQPARKRSRRHKVASKKSKTSGLAIDPLSGNSFELSEEIELSEEEFDLPEAEVGKDDDPY